MRGARAWPIVIGMVATGLTGCMGSQQAMAPGSSVVGATLGVPVVAEPPPAPGSVPTRATTPFIGQGPFSGPPRPAGSAFDRGPGGNAWERERSTERTQVSPDGSVVRTERTTTRVGFNPDGAARTAGVLGALLAPTVASSMGMSGPWRVQSSSTGHTCSLLFSSDPDQRSGFAQNIDCGPTNTVARVTRWELDGPVLSLINADGSRIPFTQQGPARFDAQITWGILSTRLALFR